MSHARRQSADHRQSFGLDQLPFHALLFGSVPGDAAGQGFAGAAVRSGKDHHFKNPGSVPGPYGHRLPGRMTGKGPVQDPLQSGSSRVVQGTERKGLLPLFQ